MTNKVLANRVLANRVLANRFVANRVLATLATAFAMLVAGMAYAGPATDVVKAKQEKLFEIIAKPESDERTAELRALFNEMLAYDQFAKGSLGSKWKDLSDDERTIFQDKLTKLVRCNYKRNLTKMLDYNIGYVDEKKKKSTFVVYTRAKHKTDEDEPEIEIDFKMKEIKGSWKAIDIYTERASLVKTYRTQFLRTIKEGGIQALFDKMDKKIKKDGCT